MSLQGTGIVYKVLPRPLKMSDRLSSGQRLSDFFLKKTRKMKNKLPISLLALVLLSNALPQRVFGQAPWVAPTGVPNFYTGLGAGARLFRALPNVLWGISTQSSGLGSYSSTLFLSADNGQTWQTRGLASSGATGASVPPSGNWLVDVDVLDGQNAWLLTKSAVNGALTFERTVSGVTGFVTLAVPPAAFKMVHFFTTTTGIALAGTTNTVYRTTDGGSTWGQVATIPPYATAAGDLIFSEQSIGSSLWLTTSNGALLRTADEGLTWTSTAGIGRKVAFENALDGLAYTPDLPPLRLLRTADGGATWTAVAFSGQPPLMDLTPIPGRPGTYLSVGSQSVRLPNQFPVFTGITAITRDRGTTWQVLGTDATLYGTVAALNDTEIWATPTYEDNKSAQNQKMLLRYSGVALAVRNTADPARQLLAYPNPTAGPMQLSGALVGNETVRVYDAAGRLCQQGQVSDAKRTLDLSAQPAGLYHVQVTAPDGSVRSQRVSKAQ
ncbi:T9SS type A sorting domain-containing protein [Hymenobacter ruricola]|uniref:T9SS type A sorting domain-containing protein n=1 Tax=Hymenobacter ruricola TaxID=2791023 RepID=A0ABS0I9E6_9BACT|nr:T9SS type A sorting domain-containing protein [Hymenobacter ruricola]MBF9223560.1 T9SS type A sorting domain-containing protein [Hymenobacter ruricola]